MKITRNDDNGGTVLNCAVRYALGRYSYMPILVMEQIRPMLPDCSDCTLAAQEWTVKKMAKLELYDYDIGMYRNVGYKCSNCGVEFGNDIYVYIGTPTFEMEQKQFSYCPNCGKPLRKLKAGEKE